MQTKATLWYHLMPTNLARTYTGVNADEGVAKLLH